MKKAEFMQAVSFVLEHDNKDEQTFMLVACLKETESDMETATMVCAEEAVSLEKYFCVISSMLKALADKIPTAIRAKIVALACSDAIKHIRREKENN